MDGKQARTPTAVFGLIAAILAAAAMVGISGCEGGRTGPNPEEQPGVGEALTYLNLQPLTGQPRPIGPGDLHGHVILLNIWGWWCGYCRAELPTWPNCGSGSPVRRPSGWRPYRTPRAIR